MSHKVLIVLLLFSCLSGCYTLRGFSISEDLKTFYVLDFRNSAPNAPATVQQTFQEQLKEKILRESRLNFDDTDPDIVFSGTITRYNVSAVAPEVGATTAANRLEVTVNVTYENQRNPDDTWTQPFSHFVDYSTNENLLSIQDQLLDQIFDQIIEDIFNKAFANW